MTDSQETVKAIFGKAIALSSPEERNTYLEAACAGDKILRAEVEELLEASDRAGRFLEQPDIELPDGFYEAATTVEEEQQDIPLDFLTPADEPGVLGCLGEYTITEIIGRGGMGIVLNGQDRHLNRTVAIKVLAPELAGNATARKRFIREAQAAAAIAHQHVITIHAVHENRLPYLVMEYIHGQSLQERIDREGPLELKEILRIGTQVASGLAAAQPPGQDWTRFSPLSEATTDEHGRYRVTGLHKGDQYQVVIEPTGDAEVRDWNYQSPFSHTLPGEGPETIELPDAKLVSNQQELRGVVVDPDGNPVPGIQVSAKLASGRHLSRPQNGPPPWTKTDENGRFRLTHLPDEPIELMAYRANPAGGSIRYPSRVTAEMNAGDIRIVLDPTLGSGIEDLDAN